MPILHKLTRDLDHGHGHIAEGCKYETVEAMLQSRLRVAQAVPDLLEALKLAEVWLANSLPLAELANRPKPLPVIRAAIAKATSPSESTSP